MLDSRNVQCLIANKKTQPVMINAMFLLGYVYLIFYSKRVHGNKETASLSCVTASSGSFSRTSKP